MDMPIRMHREDAFLTQAAADPARLLVTAQRRLLGANLTADTLLRRGDMLALDAGRVVTVNAELEPQISELLSSASHKGHRMLLTCPGGDLTWSASAKILFGADAAPQTILLSARPLMKSQPLSGAELSALFKLSPAEGRLAAGLAAGHTLAEISESSGAHISTLRAQLRSVFSKTGVSKQSEFVAAVWRAASV
ncbi:MAG: helix-turn-helix transcriptional regulator [Oceanicaulis sp.]